VPVYAQPSPGEEPRPFQRQRQQLARPELRPVGRVLPVRLEERDEVVVEVRQAARVVQELPDRHIADDRARVVLERERSLVDELKHCGRSEELGHAGDPEAMPDCQRPPCGRS
jgi:hypothetical protein